MNLRKDYWVYFRTQCYSQDFERTWISDTIKGSNGTKIKVRDLKVEALTFVSLSFLGRSLDLLVQAKNPGRQIRLHEQPSPESSYFLFEVVFFDGSTVNLLNFNSPEEFFEAFQVWLKKIHYCI